jgi:hypothetical protein
MQKAACQNSRKIIDENIRLYGELESRKKEIDRKCEQLEMFATKSNTDREKLDAAKEKVGFRYAFPVLFPELSRTTNKPYLFLI